MKAAQSGLAACALLAVGCVAPQTYSWGAYEDLIYASWLVRGANSAGANGVTPEAQVEQLEKDRQLALTKNQRLPPGWHAQLASVYFQSGKGDLARQELLAEKQAYPESAVLMDRLLANLAGGTTVPR